jgi:hypothetical protein
MGRIKAIIIVVLLVGLAAGGALFGLGALPAAQLPAMATARLATGENAVLDGLRTSAFALLQKLSTEGRNEALIAALGKLPPSEGLEGEALAQALKPAQDQLQPLVTELQTKLKLPAFALLGPDGRLLVQSPGESKLQSMRGLPPVAECLQGVSRDGILELDGKLQQMAASPLTDPRGKVAGCLVSQREITANDLKLLGSYVGLEVAIFLRQKPYASTMDDATTAALAPLLNAEAPITFGNPSEPLPLFADMTNRAFQARTLRLPSDSDEIHLAVVAPVAAQLAVYQEAQTKILYGAGALLVLGLLLAFLLGGSKKDTQAQRLLDAMNLMQEQNGYVLDEDGYTGTFQELARNLKHLMEQSRSAGAMKPAATVSQILGKASPPPSVPEMSTQDLEQIMKAQAPEPARPAPRPAAPPPVEPPVRAPVETPARPQPAAARSAAAATEGGGKGPRVSMPTDLANFFGGQEDDDATNEVSRVPPPAAFRPDVPPARPAPAARASVPPPPTVPMAFDPSQADQLDGGEDEEDVRSSDYRPDATVVAQIPDELLKQASDTTASEPARGGVALPPPRSPAIAGLGGAAVEEAHFKETFEFFLQTKKQCGEPTAGLTYEKFAEKLRANTAELKTRYRCASVRFQVYVKNGKAALKATPVK